MSIWTQPYNRRDLRGIQHMEFVNPPKKNKNMVGGRERDTIFEQLQYPN